MSKIRAKRKGKNFFITGSNVSGLVNSTTVSSSIFLKMSQSFADGEHLTDSALRENQGAILFMLQELQDDVDDIYTQISSSQYAPLDNSELQATTGSYTILNLGGTNVTSTATELNIMDGNTVASNITPVDADRVVLNDGGTMRQVTLTKLATYFDDEITNMPNLANVGTNLTVDGNITASGNISGSGKVITEEVESPTDFTLDVEGDITIDANGADIILKDDGTEFGRFKRDTSDFVIKAATNNKDILLKGVGASSTITALKLDMSEAGSATFNNHITASGDISASGDITSNTLNVNTSGELTGSYGTLHGAFNINYGNGTTFSGSLSNGQGYGDIFSHLPIHSTVSAGDVVYQSGAIFRQADADAFASAGVLLGVALADGANISGPVLIKGVVRLGNGHILNEGSGVNGYPVYVATTAGHVDYVAPSGNGDIARVVGYVLDENNDIIYFDPDKTWVEVSS